MTAVKLPTAIPAIIPASFVFARALARSLLALDVGPTEPCGGSSSRLGVVATELIAMLHEATLPVEVDGAGRSFAMLELDSSPEFQVTFKARYTPAVAGSLDSDAGVRYSLAHPAPSQANEPVQHPQKGGMVFAQVKNCPMAHSWSGKLGELHCDASNEVETRSIAAQPSSLHGLVLQHPTKREPSPHA